MKCPICNGKGGIGEIVNDKKTVQMCLTCNGTGKISQEKYDAMLNWLDAMEAISENHRSVRE